LRDGILPRAAAFLRMTVKGLAAIEDILLLVDICRHMALSICTWFNLHMDSFQLRSLQPNH
jgi:hypothetical protein